MDLLLSNPRPGPELPFGSTAFVVKRLRDQILAGVLMPGAPLRQDEIARSLGVSHTPVREAFKLLAAEDLVVLRHNRGAFVSALSVDVARELTEYRAIIEARLARISLERLTEEDFAQARRILAAADTSEDAGGRLELARSFHDIFNRAAGRPFLLEQVHRVRNNLERYWRLVWAQHGFTEATQAEHYEIVRLAERREAPRLEALVEKHVVDAGALVIAVIEAMPHTPHALHQPILR